MKKKFIPLLGLIGVLSFSALVSCGTDPENPTDNPTAIVEDVVISATKTTLEENETVKLTVKVGENTVSGATFYSEDEDVVTVSSGGIVTGVGAGTAKVWAVYQEVKSNELEFTVNGDALMKLSDVIAAGLKTTSSGDGQLYTFKGVVTNKIGNSFYMQDSTGGFYVYNYQGTNKADVVKGAEIKVSTNISNYNGLIETLYGGTTEIEVKNASATIPEPIEAEYKDITVNDQSKLYTVKDLNYVEGEVVVGTSTHTLYFKDQYDNKLLVTTDKYLDDTVEQEIRDKILSLTTLDSVDFVGVNASVSTGNKYLDSTTAYSVTLAVTSADQIIITRSTDNVDVESVSLDKESLELTVGESSQLTATVLPENATNKKVTYTSSDTSVASVSDAGKVSAKKAGTTTITVKTVDNNKTATCEVTVKEKETPSEFTGVSCTIEKEIPAGWEYITNNEAYPDPGFYSGGGLKMNYTSMGLWSEQFAAYTGEVEVTLNINAFNKKSDAYGNETPIFTVTFYKADLTTVSATLDFDTVSKGANKLTVNVEEAVKAKIILVNFPDDGNGYQSNVNLGGVTIKPVGGDEPASSWQVCESPVVDTNYKFGFYSTNDDVTYYCLNELTGYYGATTTDPEEAADYSLVATSTEGEYYIKATLNETVKYLNIVVSGTYYNIKFEDTPSTQYKIEEARHIPWCEIEGTKCTFGTYGTYKTLNVIKGNYFEDESEYFAKFYTKA